MFRHDNVHCAVPLHCGSRRLPGRTQRAPTPIRLHAFADSRASGSGQRTDHGATRGRDKKAALSHRRVPVRIEAERLARHNTVEEPLRPHHHHAWLGLGFGSGSGSGFGVRGSGFGVRGSEFGFGFGFR